MSENTDFTLERQFPRVPFGKTPWVFTMEAKDPQFSSSPVQLEAQNVSLGGIKFCSNRKIAIFDVIKVRLMDREGKNPPLNLLGKVIRVEETDLGLDEKTFGMAIEFVEVAPEAKQVLADILDPLSLGMESEV